MTDREKAIEVLKKAGAFCNYMDSSFSEYVLPNKASVCIRANGDVEIKTKCRYLPSLLSDLTLEDVIWQMHDALWDVVKLHGKPEWYEDSQEFVDDVMARVRQQVNGDTCTREEG